MWQRWHRQVQGRGLRGCAGGPGWCLVCSAFVGGEGAVRGQRNGECGWLIGTFGGVGGVVLGVVGGSEILRVGDSFGEVGR